MAYTEILIKTYDLADELKESKLYQEIIRLDNLIKEKYQEELKAYKEAFNKFDECFSTGGKYHPDFKDVSKTYQATKEILFSKEEVKAYFLNESKLNEILKEIVIEIRNNVSNYEDLKGGVCSWI